MTTREPVNILLVDDDPGKVLSYESILAGLGENLIRATSARAALDQLLKKEFAVVLVDVCMPELDGFELAAMIRNHPRFEKTAIILVSAVLVDDANQLKGYGAGAVDYVSVPIVPEILRAKVAVFADLYRKTVELERLNQELEQRVADRTVEIEAALKQAEDARREAEAADRLKDEFLATLSHELRTPLSAIMGWAHLLQSEGLDKATQQKGVETIRRNAQAQSQLISDILDVSRIIVGKLRLQREPVRLHAVIQAVLDTLGPAALAKGVRLEARLAEGDAFVMADAERLNQVLWNLVSNAIKFSPTQGKVRLSLEAVGSQFEIKVEDNGPGIDPAFLPHIFDRFRQADSSSTRPQQGLGLGLAIVKHLVTLHDGTVEATNRQERAGAMFKVTLPRHVSGTGDVGADTGPLSPLGEAAGPGSMPSLKGVSVLIVDDDEDGGDIAATILGRCGAEAKVAASAREAIEIISRDPPDVLLTDLEMPGEDGYALLRRVRSLPSERSARIPAAAFTAYASGQDRVKVLDAGFQLHLAKPAQPVELALAVARLAQMREAEQGQHS